MAANSQPGADGRRRRQQAQLHPAPDRELLVEALSPDLLLVEPRAVVRDACLARDREQQLLVARGERRVAHPAAQGSRRRSAHRDPGWAPRAPPSMLVRPRWGGSRIDRPPLGQHLRRPAAPDVPRPGASTSAGRPSAASTIRMGPMSTAPASDRMALTRLRQQQARDLGRIERGADGLAHAIQQVDLAIAIERLLTEHPEVDGLREHRR